MSEPSTRSFVHELPFGATLKRDGTASFRIWAPSTPSLALEVEGQPPLDMASQPGGWFEAVAPAGAGTQYSFRMPDGLKVPDPASRLQAGDVHSPSVITDPSTYQWRNTSWQGRPWHEAVIYEVHVGLCGGFSGVRQRLPELARLGVTVVELMPIADFPGGRNWGYDGVLPFAPDASYGTPDELRALVDEAHGLGLSVMLDVVHNHFGPDGAYLHVYAKPFFRDDISTPWGAAIDFRKPEVRDYFIQSALGWIMEFRFDGLRFDAVHAIAEEDFLVELASTIRSKAEPGRYIHLVLEHENNRAALLRPGSHGPQFDAQWADDMHHCLHVLLTGEHEGYYADFQDSTKQLARCLAEGFAYQGDVSPHLGRPRGEPSADLPPTAFVMCLQNHDQIGNRAMGERLTTLAGPAALEAATALLLLSPFVPMLFMGEEWGAKDPFLYFTSHNDELAELVREGRRAEFKGFSAFQDEARRAAIPDPNATSTFEMSRPDQANPGRFEFIRNLLSLRREHVMPGIPGCRSLGASVLAPGAVQAAWRLGTGAQLTITLNLGAAPVAPSPASSPVLFASASAQPGAVPPGGVVVQLSQAGAA